MAKKYTVSDGKLVLTLREAEEGGYVVTSPLDPELVTQAQTVGEAFTMARDALKALRESRGKPVADDEPHTVASCVGILPDEDAREMRELIESEFEKVDLRDWK